MNHEQIAILAYRLWEERGCPDGSPHLDWERAEIMLRAGAEPESREIPATEAPEVLDIVKPRRDQVSARGQGSPASRH